MNTIFINKQSLWDILEAWNPYLPRKVRVVACGGTALTLQDLKASTKDVDFLVPDEAEYKALLHTIEKLGYRQATRYGWAKDDGFTFDLFPGKVVFTTELLDSPLDDGRNIHIRTFSRIAVSALNDLDLIISKMFRGHAVDVEDCLTLLSGRPGGVDLDKLKERYNETAQGHLNSELLLQHLEYLLNEWKSRR